MVLFDYKDDEVNQITYNTLEAARIKYQGYADLLKELSEEMKEILYGAKVSDEK